MSVKTKFTRKRTNPSRKLKIPSNQGITIQLNDSRCDESQKRIATAKMVNRITNEENNTKCSVPRDAERKRDRFRELEHPWPAGEPRQ
jgi:hypothetical protein